MRNGAADTTGSGTFQVVHGIIFGAGGGGGEEDGSRKRRHGGVGGVEDFDEEKVRTTRFGLDVWMTSNNKKEGEQCSKILLY